MSIDSQTDLTTRDYPSRAKHVPRATYRLQFNKQFTFVQAQEVVSYLHDLGLSDAYASPLFQAGPESTHGYDICCFGTLSRSIGTEEEFLNFSDELRRAGIGLLLDMVPNHMGADLSNSWWRDVLEKGVTSDYASYFDIDWQPIKRDLHNKVLLPVLGDHYGKVIAKGDLKLSFSEGRFFIAYYDHHFPLAPHSYALVLKPFSAELRGGTKASEGVRQMEKLAEAVGLWQASTRLSGKEILNIQQELRRWFDTSEEFRTVMAQVLKGFNGKEGDPHSFDSLDELLRMQHYRLSYWRVASEEINYRRFFEVTSLISLRMERPEVFEATHGKLLEWIAEKRITGLRIDHPDGLWDPLEYFQRLQNLHGKKGSSGTARTPSGPLYVVVEKILSDDETIPVEWPIDGTTGYDFLNQLNSIFVKQENEGAFNTLYSKFTGASNDFDELVYTSKKKILERSLYSEWVGLTHRFKRVALASRDTQDLTFRQLQSALGEVIAAFPVYRTYARTGNTRLSEAEARYVKQGCAKAKKRAHDLDPAVWSFVEEMLLLRRLPEMADSDCPECLEIVMRFQQLTGPVMAKGLEDTAFYNYNRLVSLNEVGGNPGKFGESPDAFHSYNAMRARSWPHSLSSTATHDTKRGEDLRARLNVLSEMPEEWEKAINDWRLLNQEKSPVLHPNDEYLLYQTLVGAWTPEAETADGLHVFKKRIIAYMEKALKEAKARTSWTDPDVDYEKSVSNFVERILDPTGNRAFVDSLRKFSQRIAPFGYINSLAQVVLKIGAPGVPDFYQGTELWDFNLVDPDNRRPVDYALRQKHFDGLKQVLSTEQNLIQLTCALLKEPTDGRIKMLVMHLALDCRARHPDIFEGGDYQPLEVEGPLREHCFGFERTCRGKSVICVVPLHLSNLLSPEAVLRPNPHLWQGNVVLPRVSGDGRFRNVLTGEDIAVRSGEVSGQLFLAEVFGSFPVAILEAI